MDSLPPDDSSNITRAPGARRYDIEPSVIRFANLLLAHPRLVIGLPIACAALAVLYVTLRGPLYEAEAVLEPRTTEGGLGPVAGLAAQIGINVPGLGSPGSNVQFFGKLLSSNALLGEVAATQYAFSTGEPGNPTADSLRGTLMDLFEVKGRTEDQRLRSAVRRLRRSISVRTDQPSGTVTLITRLRWPELAVKVNRRIIEMADEYNASLRQSQAGAEAEFTRERLAEAREELQEAESALERFLRQNALYRQSPELVLEFDRLDRQVSFREQLVLALQQAHESARIDAVRNTPVLNVLDTPEAGVRRLTGRALRAAVGLMVGLMLAIAAAVLLEHMRRQQAEHPGEFSEFERLKRSVPRRLLPARLRRD